MHVSRIEASQCRLPFFQFNIIPWFPIEYSEEALNKIQLYYASNFLYERGKSHPQVVEILSKYEDDRDLVVSIADKAQFDLWRIIFNKVQELTSQGLTYDEIHEQVKSMEEDPEIVDFICNIWYKVRLDYVDNFVESAGNVFLGMKWVIISSFVCLMLFLIKASIVSKVFWSLICLLSIATWLYGVRQKKLARKLEHILDYDFSKFDKLI